ncbi:MAG: DEAD/DEAH box helicase [Bacteriovoracaceae bacterium]|nr:DEAD/DEAH box helicase [Bacteriovoracaceae bacterium]
MSDFKSLKLLPEIMEAIEKVGYTTPTPIQAQAIPHLMEGKDLLGIAQTGTGKTAAFTLPILNKLGSNRVKARPARMRCLILTPTRELASQINQNIQDYGKKLNIKSTVIFGGVGQRPQVQAMSRGQDFLVATPGRLLDLMGQGHVLYDQLEVFVLDEADRMLDMGFFNDVKKIIAKLPKEKQTLLFSATMPKDIANLANSLLKNPVRVEITPEASTVEKIDQKINFVDKTNKPLLLESILKDKSIKTMLVFTRTKHGANRVVKHLDNFLIKSAAIHGNKSQGARERALEDFKNGKIRVLVATDIAARGIDVSNITHIINYDLPDDPKSYVHRIGRTARAGREGVAISFCDPNERGLLKDIEKTIKQAIPVDTEHAFHGVAAQPSRAPQTKGRPPKGSPQRASKPKSNDGKEAVTKKKKRPSQRARSR